MKNATALLTILFLQLFSPQRSFCRENFPFALSSQGKMNIWLDINAGYSNHGPAGWSDINWREDRFVFSAGYFKSHQCYESQEINPYFLDEGERHETVESISLMPGIILPGKFRPCLSVGIAWLRFKYVTTLDIEHNVTVKRIWETILNKDYTSETLQKKFYTTIGVPVEFKLHFSSSTFAGFDAGIRAYLTNHSQVIMAGIGLRLGHLSK
jgi:hypothetical protein